MCLLKRYQLYSGSGFRELNYCNPYRTAIRTIFIVFTDLIWIPIFLKAIWISEPDNLPSLFVSSVLNIDLNMNNSTINSFYWILAWEPSVNLYLPPPFTRTWSYITIVAVISYKSRPTQLKISKPSKEHFRGSLEFPNQNWRKIGPVVNELRSEIQTNRDYYFKYVDYWNLLALEAPLPRKNITLTLIVFHAFLDAEQTLRLSDYHCYLNQIS